MRFSILHGAAMRISLHRLLASNLIALAMVVGAIPGTAAEEDTYTFQIDSISVEPATKIEMGKKAVIHCHWSAKFAGDKKLYEVKTPSGKGHIHVEYQNLKKGYPNSIKVVPGLAKPGYYTKESPMKGEFLAAFDPEIASPAVAVCMIQAQGQTQYHEFAQKLLPIWVTQPPLAIASPGSAPSAAAPVAAPPPNLSVLGAIGVPGGCGANPGQFVTAKLNIKNAGKTLPPNRAVVRIRSEWAIYPINLSSGDFPLPEIKAGEVRAVDVPVAFVNFDKQGVAELAGTTRLLTVEIAPKVAGAFAQVKGLSFPVSFPPGLCAASTSAPSARTAAPAGVPLPQGSPGSREPQTRPSNPAAPGLPARPGVRQP
jgi:hypothetical protein